MEVEEQREDPKDIVLRKRGAINRKENRVWNKIPIAHQSCHPLSYASFLLDGRDGWQQRDVLEYDANDTSIARDREGNFIKNVSGVQPMPLIEGGQPPHTTEEKGKDEKMTKKSAVRKENCLIHGESRNVAW